MELKVTNRAISELVSPKIILDGIERIEKHKNEIEEEKKIILDGIERQLLQKEGHGKNILIILDGIESI